MEKKVIWVDKKIIQKMLVSMCENTKDVADGLGSEEKLDWVCLTWEWTTDGRDEVVKEARPRGRN